MIKPLAIGTAAEMPNVFGPQLWRLDSIARVGSRRHGRTVCERPLRFLCTWSMPTEEIKTHENSKNPSRNRWFRLQTYQGFQRGFTRSSPTMSRVLLPQWGLVSTRLSAHLKRYSHRKPRFFKIGEVFLAKDFSLAKQLLLSNFYPLCEVPTTFLIGSFTPETSVKRKYGGVLRM